jgi:uncharacterized lipoprotein
MKKILAAALVIASLSACHYGQDEAKQTLERNELYKTEKADYSVNKAGEYGNPNESVKTSVDTAAADTTKK